MAGNAVSSVSTPTPLAELRKHKKPLRNVHREVRESLGLMNTLAVWVTERVGTMGFFFIIFVWSAIWLAWNFLAPANLQFDPPMAFVFWLFISNLIQILLMPLIMVGQNIQGIHAEARAEHDLEVNVRAEREIEVILQHLEYQGEILMKMVDKLGVDIKGLSTR